MKNEQELRAGDKVFILNKEGVPCGKGVIYNISDFREPNMKYAVDVEGYEEDVLFFGEKDLVKIDWGIKNHF